MHQELGRPSFAEAVVSETLGHNPRLERIDEAVDWERSGGSWPACTPPPAGGPDIRRC